MRKILPFLLMMIIISARAQQPISININGKIPAYGMIQSDFIAVNADDNIEISPNIQFTKVTNYLLNGAAKALGTGALAWQLDNRIGPPAKENGKQVSSFPAIGMGIVVGVPDLFNGFRKNRQATLLYTFYTKDRKLIESKKIYLNKQGIASVKEIVRADGFMVVTLVNGREMKMVNGDVLVNVKKKEQYKGGMVKNMKLNMMGDCLPPVIVCPPSSTDVDEWDDGLTHYRFTCVTSWEPNYDIMDCDASIDCELESWDRPDYVEYTYTEYYSEGDCTECEREVSVWASGNETYGPPSCHDIPNCGDPDPDPNPTDPETITNNATDPCIKTPIDNILALNTNEGTRNILENAFGTNRPFDLILNQTFNTVADGAGETWPPASGSNDIVINLSRPVLDGSSRQFAAGAVLHEIYHAYLLTLPNMPTDQNGQHEYMIQNFTDDIASTLKTLFPTLTDQEAWSLAMGGYGGVQSSNPTMWNDAITACNCGLTDAIVTHVNSYQKLGLEGAPCQ